MEKRSRHSRLRYRNRQHSEIPYPAEKSCSTCKTIKAATCFGKNKAEKDGLRSQCKECAAIKSRERYLRNPQRQIDAVAVWQKANPDKVRENAKRTYYNNYESRRIRAKAAYEANKCDINETARQRYKDDPQYCEKARLASLKHYQANAEKRVAYQKRYKAENPENTLIWSNNRRSRKKNAAGECSTQDWADRLEEFGYSCAYCLKPESEVGKMTVDHMTPLSRGGSNDVDNLVPCCRSCNSSKNDKTLLEFLAFKAWKETALNATHDLD